MMRVIVTLLVLCLLLGCAKHPPASTIRFYNDAERSTVYDPETQMSQLEKANPLVDAASAFKAGDYAFVALGGMVVDVPGFASRADVRNSLKLKTILGTGGTNQKFEELAKGYALKYNIKILELLQTGQ